MTLQEKIDELEEKLAKLKEKQKEQQEENKEYRMIDVIQLTIGGRRGRRDSYSNPKELLYDFHYDTGGSIVLPKGINMDLAMRYVHPEKGLTIIQTFPLIF